MHVCLQIRPLLHNIVHLIVHLLAVCHHAELLCVLNLVLLLSLLLNKEAGGTGPESIYQKLQDLQVTEEGTLVDQTIAESVARVKQIVALKVVEKTKETDKGLEITLLDE